MMTGLCVCCGMQTSHMIVRVQGQSSVASDASKFGYYPPVVTAVSPLMSSTAGGVTVSFSGANFGPENATLTVMLVYPVATAQPLLCAVTWHNHTDGECVVPEGSGAGFRFVVATEHQTSAAASDANGNVLMFNYLAPVIMSVTGASASNGTPHVLLVACCSLLVASLR